MAILSSNQPNIVFKHDVLRLMPL